MVDEVAGLKKINSSSNAVEGACTIDLTFSHFKRG